ncbi:MAG: rod shape-determining protein MreC [Planctomycetota bacterium]
MSAGSRARRRSAYVALGVWAALIALGLPLRICSPVTPLPPSELELSRLRQRAVSLEEENAALRQRLSVLTQVGQPLSGYRPIPASMFPYRDLGGERSSALVDIGQDHGVRVGFGVICDAGVVGRVAEVWKTQSRLALADDPSFRAHFTRSSDGAEGVAIGGVGPGLLCPAYLRERTRFEVGDLLITAGEIPGTGAPAIFPRGIVLGEVSEAHVSPESVRVRLPVRWTDLRAVIILVPPGQ